MASYSTNRKYSTRNTIPIISTKTEVLISSKMIEESATPKKEHVDVISPLNTPTIISKVGNFIKKYLLC